MPSDLREIRVIFLPPEYPGITSPIADERVTLQLEIVFITGPLSTIAPRETIDKVGDAEVSEAFPAVIGANY